LIELLRSKDGMTLDASCKKFGWQSHTTRALMSAGGSLTKKHGITVISEKVGEVRTYRITDRAHILETGIESYRFRRTMNKQKKGGKAPEERPNS
jgi:hypothetical protein